MMPHNPQGLYLASAYLSAYKDFCLNNGIDLLQLIDSMDEHSELLEQLLAAPSYVPARSYFQLNELLEPIVQRPLELAYKLGLWQAQRNAHGTLGLTIRSARNYIHAVELMRQYGLTRTNIIPVSLNFDRQYAYFSLATEPAETLTHSDPVRAFVFSSYLFNSVLFLQRSLCPSQRQFRADIYLKTPLPGGPVVFDDCIYVEGGHSDYLLRVPMAVAEASFSTRNAKTCERLRLVLERDLEALAPPSVSDKVSSFIESNDWPQCSIEHCARQFNLSVSSLQRRLRREGSSFEQIKRRQRMQQAQQLLRYSTLTLEAIAATLGYSNCSNFNKSFNTACGQSPMSFRKRSAPQQFFEQ